jgi:hypothetical protein
MELPIKLYNEIVNFLISLPNIEDSQTQKALIYSAGLDRQLQRQIIFGGSASLPAVANFGILLSHIGVLLHCGSLPVVRSGQKSRDCRRSASNL